MTRTELEFYSHNVPAIRKALERIADALEGNNNLKEQTVNKAVDRILDDGIDFQVNETLQAEENEELDTQHDYLHQLVQNLDNNGYQEFCNTHCLRANDAIEVSNYIMELDYSEVLGAIKELEEKSDDQANEDAIELKHGHFSEKIGVPYDDDYDLRITARMYADELEAGNFRYKKDAILDYVTNEFGSQGARYTDIIKFAYYLNNDHSPKFGYNDRGYYSQAISGRKAHLTQGGNDCLVKGINKEGDERYFAHSFVESVTDYWKYCDNTKKDSNNPDYNYM